MHVRHCVSKCEVDPNAGAAWNDPKNDVKGYATQLLNGGVPGRQFVLQGEADANTGTALNDPNNNVKGSEVNSNSEGPEVQVESSFPCDRGQVNSIYGHSVGDKDQGVVERDHVTNCLKGVIHEPLFEKMIFQTANPIHSYDEGSDPVVDSLQVELRGQVGRPPGESQSRNDAALEFCSSDRAVCGFRLNLATAGHEKLAVVVTKKIAGNEVACVRHEKPIKDGIREAGTVPKTKS